MTKQSQRGEYATENRNKAIKMVTEWGMTNKKAAEQLGCSVESVRRWVSEYRKTIQPVQVQEELDLVKKFQFAQKRIKQLEQENDFLKKVTAYFARESK